MEDVAGNDPWIQQVEQHAYVGDVVHLIDGAAERCTHRERAVVLLGVLLGEVLRDESAHRGADEEAAAGRAPWLVNNPRNLCVVCAPSFTAQPFSENLE